MNNDEHLIQIVDAAMAEAVARSGHWLACRLGCFDCCLGPFPITQLDAVRLCDGLRGFDENDPARAARVRQRAQAAIERMRRAYPNDPVRSVLEQGEAFDDDPCPALDPETGACDLYAARPITCRTFGPAVRIGADSMAICELCYRGASDEEIATCEVEVDPENLESRLVQELETSTGVRGETIVAFALLDLSK
jgi:Fe-S-cluster containining protein